MIYEPDDEEEKEKEIDKEEQEPDEPEEPDDYFDDRSPWNYAELREMRGIRNEY